MSDLNNSEQSVQQPTENTAPQAAPEQTIQAAIEPPRNIVDMITDDTLRGEASLSNFKDINSLAKSYVHLNKKLGSAISIPGEDASLEAKQEFYNKLANVKDLVKLPDPNNQEEVNAFYNRLGRPTAPDQYDIKLPQDVPEDLIDRNMLNTFREKAFNLGLTSQQVNELVHLDLQRQAQHWDALAAEKETNSAILKKMWGNDFDARSQAAQRMIEVYGQKFPEATKALLSKHVTDPLIYQMLAEMGQIYQERGHIPSQSARFGLTPDEARAKISEIRSNPRHPANVGTDPNHEAALQQLSELYKHAYPSEG